MKTLLLLLLATTVAAADTFVPSHRLAAQMRFEAKRAGESFEDYTPHDPVLNADSREFYKARRDANTKRRVDAIVSKYDQQRQAHEQSKQPSDQPTLQDRIDELERQLTQAKLDALEASKPEPETIEAEPSVDSNNTLKQAGVAGGIGAAAALLATGATLLFRRRV